MLEMCNEERTALLKEAFLLYSLDNTLQVPVCRVGMIFRQIGIYLPDPELAQTISRMETTDDGTVTFSTFQSVLQAKINEVSAEDELESVFKFIDQNNDGFISKLDLRLAARSLGYELSEIQIGRLMSVFPEEYPQRQINFEQFVLYLNQSNVVLESLAANRSGWKPTTM